MDDAAEKALEALKFQIKKEIVDHYFGERVYLEDDTKFLHEEVEAYHREATRVSRLFLYFYQALGSEPAITQVMEQLGLKEWPCYEEFCEMSPGARQELLRDRGRRGFTSFSRFRNLVFDLYDEMQQENQDLQEKYHKIQNHLRLLNEDIDKFNCSFDFGLIAAQLEAMEGGPEPLSGGLLASEREELSTRMRFKHQKLPQDLPAPVDLPPLKEIKAQLGAILEKTYMG